MKEGGWVGRWAGGDNRFFFTAWVVVSAIHDISNLPPGKAAADLGITTAATMIVAAA